MTQMRKQVVRVAGASTKIRKDFATALLQSGMAVYTVALCIGNMLMVK